MVNVQPTNVKLRDRAARIITTLTDLPHDEATALLDQAGSVKTAIVMQRLNLSRADAEERLAQAKGRLRTALS